MLTENNDRLKGNKKIAHSESNICDYMAQEHRFELP
jgi:hypothetical protein